MNDHTVTMIVMGMIGATALMLAQSIRLLVAELVKQRTMREAHLKSLDSTGDTIATMMESARVALANIETRDSGPSVAGVLVRMTAEQIKAAGVECQCDSCSALRKAGKPSTVRHEH